MQEVGPPAPSPSSEEEITPSKRSPTSTTVLPPEVSSTTRSATSTTVVPQAVSSTTRSPTSTTVVPQAVSSTTRSPTSTTVVPPAVSSTRRSPTSTTRIPPAVPSTTGPPSPPSPPVSPCSSAPCLNRGICRNMGPNDFRCICPVSYTGDLCQYLSGPVGPGGRPTGPISPGGPRPPARPSPPAGPSPTVSASTTVQVTAESTSSVDNPTQTLPTEKPVGPLPTSKTCSPIDLRGGGTVRYNKTDGDGLSYSPGTAAILSCPELYGLTGTGNSEETTTCVDGEWQPRPAYGCYISRSDSCPQIYPIPCSIPVTNYCKFDHNCPDNFVCCSFVCGTDCVKEGRAKVTPCPPLPDPENGRNRAVDRDFFKSIICNPGYRLVGPGRIACIDGQWNDTAPTCERIGGNIPMGPSPTGPRSPEPGPPGLPVGPVGPRGEATTSTSTVPTTRTTITSAGTNASSTSAVPKTPGTTSTQRVPSTSTQSSTSVTPTALSDPIYEEFCDEIFVSFSKISYNDTIDATRQYPSYTTATFTCVDSLTYSGPASSQCIDGKWTPAPNGVCSRGIVTEPSTSASPGQVPTSTTPGGKGRPGTTTPPPPPIPEECQMPVIEDGIVRFIPEEKMAVFNCSTDHVLVGPSALLCQQNGKWNDSMPFCQRANLDGPPFIIPDFCESSPCQNGATCETDHFRYTCTCPMMFIGYNCQKIKPIIPALNYIWTCKFEDDDRIVDGNNVTSWCTAIQAPDDQMDWSTSPYSGRTPSEPTGPEAPFEGLRYIYLEASSPAVLNDEAALLIPVEEYRGRHCMVFAYSMNGFHINQLRVETRQRNQAPGTKAKQEWICRGAQGVDWQVANIQLDIGENDLIGIVATRGSEYSGDIAIDDLRLAEGDCAVTTVSCMDMVTPPV